MKWDKILPHRAAINHSLRKESENLKKQIDAYKVRYEQRFAENEKEIDAYIEGLNSDISDERDRIQSRLIDEEKFLSSIADEVFTYVSTYHDNSILIKKKEKYTVQLNTVKEYITFLSSQMREIGKEIDILENRRKLLSGKTKIDDVISLINQSGEAINTDGIFDSLSLLQRINCEIRECPEDNDIKYFALMNVRLIIEERVSYISEIQYISWIIEQKRQLSKEIKQQREKQNVIRDSIQNEINTIQNSIDPLLAILSEKSKLIRFHFARELIKLTAEIGDAYDKKKEILDDIKKMKEEHSSDSYKWDRLQSDRKEIIDEINDIKNRKKNILSLRSSLISEMKNNGAPLQFIGDRKKTDEDIYAEIRVAEIERIAEESMAIAIPIYEEELKQLNNEKISKENEILQRIQEIEKRLNELKEKRETIVVTIDEAKKNAEALLRERINTINAKITSKKNELINAEKRLSKIKEADKRFFLVKFFSDNPEEVEIVRVKRTINSEIRKFEDELKPLKDEYVKGLYSSDSKVKRAMDNLTEIEAQIAQTDENLIAEKELYSGTVSEYEKKIRRLKPKPDRHTSKESTELYQIKSWRENQKEARRERREK